MKSEKIMTDYLNLSGEMEMKGMIKTAILNYIS